MDQSLRDLIENTMKTFEPYHVTDPALLREIEALREKYTALAEKTGDMMRFINAAPESGIYEEYTRVMTKVVMKQNAQEAEKDRPADQGSTPVPTVREYLSQYRTAYEEVAKHPERPNGKAAYERLFRVADETDDMLEAQILIEKDHLLWDLTYYDSIDIFKDRLKDLDPLFLPTTAALLNSIRAVENAHSAEEYAYWASKMEVQSLSDAEAYQAGMIAAIHLALRLVEFSSLKRDFYGLRDRNRKRGCVMGLLMKREQIRKILAFMEDALGLGYEKLLQNEGLKIWLLAPETADDGKGLGRLRDVMYPQNYDVFTDIINNDIRPEVSAAEILARRPEQVLWYRL